MSNYSRLANQAIRIKAKEAGVPLWMLASELHMSECTISRNLRTELPQQEQDRYLKAIDTLSERASGTAAEG